MQKEIATASVRLYPSTRKQARVEAAKKGKTLATYFQELMGGEKLKAKK